MSRKSLIRMNHKDRHVVLLNDLDSADTLFNGVGITGTFAHPLPPTSVSLMWHRQGRAQTGLNKPSVAVCTWIVTATPADILLKRGSVPSRDLLTILQHVQGNQPPPPPQPPPTTSTGS
jgi:hypothetical protein